MADAVSLFNRGMEHMQQSEFAEAAECFRQVIAIDPKYQGVYQQLGYAYSSLGEFITAHGAFLQSVKAEPKSPHAYLTLAASFASFGHLKESDRVLEQAIALDPGNLEVRFSAAHLLFQTDTADFLDNDRCWRAVDQLLIIVAARSDYPNAYALLGRIYVDLSQFREAEEAFKKQLGFDRESRLAKQGMAILKCMRN